MVSFVNLLTQIKVRNNLYRVFRSTQPQIQEKTIKVDKWNINYIKVGKGPHHVFCLPGALGTIWTDFTPQIEAFDKDKFTLVVWDPPGYGKSRPPDKEFTKNFYTKDTAYAFEFMRALKINKYSMMGWSDGGATALIHAARYPDVVNKLVAIAAVTRINPKKRAIFTHIRDLNTWTETKRKVMNEIYGDALASYWNRWVDRHAALSQVDNGQGFTHLLKDIKCPTYIIYGGKDYMSPPYESVHIVKNIKGSRSHVYPDGKHNVHIKYAEEFNKRVQEFLLEP